MTKAEKIFDLANRFVKKKKQLPTVPELLKLGVTRGMIRHHFGNITTLQNLLMKKNKKLRTTLQNEKTTIYKALGIDYEEI